MKNPRGAGKPAGGSTGKVPNPSDSPTMYERAQVFIAENPKVLDLMIEHTRAWVRSTGRKRLGINALIERVRWEVAISTTTDEPWAINNSFGPYLAREIMRQAPDLDGVFTTRSSMADRHYGVVRWPGTDIRLDRPNGALW